MFFSALVTLLATTRCTNLAARWTGVRTFLPLLSVKRFNAVGGFGEELLSRQMDGCKSFEDTYWVDYWTKLATEQLELFKDELKKAGLQFNQAWIDELESLGPSPEVLEFLSKGASLITQSAPGATINHRERHKVVTAEEEASFAAVEALLKSVGYYFIAAWPGRTQMRDRAYRTCERLFDILLDATAPTIDLRVERHVVQTNGENVKLYALLPAQKSCDTAVELPAILISNGLEGTNVETLSSAIRSQSSISCCFFFMEMPGTYAYNRPMRKVTSESIYSDVFTYMQSHPSVDASRLGMMGISFGGNCATRMAIADKRIKAIVANGPPLAQSLKPTASIGTPEIIVATIHSVLGAASIGAFQVALRDLAPERREIECIRCPVLAINGDKDTLVSTQDTIDLAAWAPDAKLCIYSNDDHCAMGHLHEWFDLSRTWIQDKLKD